MTDEQILYQFFELISAKDLSALEKLLDTNTRLYFPKAQPLTGKKRILRFMSILFRQYPQLFFDVKEVILQGNRAAVHWTNKGVSRKKEPYQNEGVTLLRFEGQKINYISDFFKDTEKF